MHIELIELLRCPRQHEENSLVAALDRVEDRTVLQGRLGCPVCGAEFPIVDAVANLSLPRAAEAPKPAAAVEPRSDRMFDAWRLAALLDLRPPAAVAVLAGEAGRAAYQLLEIFPGRLVLLNPPAECEPGHRVAIILSPGVIPLRTRTANAVALGAGDERLLADAVRVLGGGGRVVAPAAWPVPTQVRELARDDLQWVAAADAPTPHVRLTLNRG
jgi:uncharacterized protein YbaR (Trm112 family)